MFDADRPIVKAEQDRLNRAVFAKYLARCMLDHKDPDSLVVGLYGSWGSGKTSIINLVMEELNFALTNLEDPEKPIILNFSPWSYSGQGQLVYSFFRRLSSALRSVEYLENNQKIIYLLEWYVSFFTRQPVPKPLRKKKTFWEKITSKEDAHEKFAWESGRDLTLIKAELNEILRAQKHKIIIIIDNISRLYNDEVKQIFQIIKSMGDLANTIYLLALDKNQVIHAIDEEYGFGGNEFLEKIVQLPFEVPPILQQDLENIFSDRIKEVAASVPEEAWDIEYWADLYYNSLKYFFETCRDVTRYANTLYFSYSRLRDVVNPMDFFALTTIEIFTPEIYFSIRENKDLFTDLLDEVYVLDDEQIQKDKLRCDEILSRDIRVNKDIMLQLLTRLFPRIRKIYFPEEIFYHSDDVARKLKRICSPDSFDAYFRLSMQTGHIPHSEFETILQMAADKSAFDQALTRLNQDDRVTKFLDLLDDYKIIKSVPCDHIQAIIHALLDNGDLFPRGNSHTLSLDTPMRIHRIIHALLHKIPSSEQRFILLQQSIANATKSIYIIVHELQEQGREHMEESDTYQPMEFRDLTTEQLTSLQTLTVSRIEYWAKHNDLADHPRLLPILSAWQVWSGNDACKQFVKETTNTDRGLIAFLIAALDKPIAQAMTAYEISPAWEKYLENINAFIPPRQLVDHARTLFEDEYFEKLREKEQLALMIFLDLMKAPTKKIIRKTS